MANFALRTAVRVSCSVAVRPDSPCATPDFAQLLDTLAFRGVSSPHWPDGLANSRYCEWLRGLLLAVDGTRARSHTEIGIWDDTTGISSMPTGMVRCNDAWKNF